MRKESNDTAKPVDWRIEEMPYPVSLSYSRLNKLLQCPRSFELVFIEGVEYLVSPYLFLGGTIHAALTQGFRQKINGASVSIEEMEDTFRDIWSKGDSVEVDWKQEDAGDLKDTGVILIRKYWNTIQPHIKPLEVEMTFTKEMGDIILRGKVDLIAQNGVVIELKTTKRAYSEREIQRHLQPSIYALGMGGDINFRFDLLVKVKVPYCLSIPTKRTPAELSWIANVLLPKAAEQIRSGIYPPNPTSWLCGDSCEVLHFCKGGCQ